MTHHFLSRNYIRELLVNLVADNICIFFFNVSIWLFQGNEMYKLWPMTNHSPELSTSILLVNPVMHKGAINRCMRYCISIWLWSQYHRCPHNILAWKLWCIPCVEHKHKSQNSQTGDNYPRDTEPECYSSLYHSSIPVSWCGMFRPASKYQSN